MSDPKCNGCTYEVTEVSERGYCQTCQDVFSRGFDEGLWVGQRVVLSERGE